MSVPVENINIARLFCNTSFIFKRNLERYYRMRFRNKTHVKYVCYKNFYYVSGDMVHTCADNGTWLGEQPLCRPSYYMQKWHLMVIIILTVLVVVVLFLLPNIIMFYLKRRAIRLKVSTLSSMRRGHKYIKYPRRWPPIELTDTCTLIPVETTV